HRDASVRIVESLEQLGGQVSAVYPEKHIFDVAGFPKVNGQELIDRLIEQAQQYGPEVRLGEVVERIEHRDDEVIELHTAAGETLLTRTMIITAGHGAFNPRTLGLPELETFAGSGLHYYVKEKAHFSGKRVALVGGGDSALDWAMNLQDTAELPITLIHRRERLRGAEGNGRLQAITVENTETGEFERIEVDAVVTLLGFISHLGPIADWGLE